MEYVNGPTHAFYLKKKYHDYGSFLMKNRISDTPVKNGKIIKLKSGSFRDCGEGDGKGTKRKCQCSLVMAFEKYDSTIPAKGHGIFRRIPSSPSQ